MFQILAVNDVMEKIKVYEKVFLILKPTLLFILTSKSLHTIVFIHLNLILISEEKFCMVY